MAYEILARKYRPRTFEEMVGQKGVVQTLRNALASGRITQAYLFSGMRGTGKTTAARILAKALNCVQGPTATPCDACESCVEIREDRAIDVLEIDGASNRKVEDADALRDSVKYKPVKGRYKIIIIDEVHMLTGHAFNALLKTLEEPPEKTVFILATTEFQKVPATIVSRCQYFEFRKIGRREIAGSLAAIAAKESVTISPSGLDLIAGAADGSLRDAQSILDQVVAFSGQNVRDEDVREILGVMGRDLFFEAASAVLEENPSRVFPLVERIVDGGHDLRHYFKELIEHFRELLMVKAMARPEDLLFVTPEELARLREQAEKASAEDFLRYLSALQQAEGGLRYTSQPRIYLEALLVRLCHFKKIVPLQELIREVRGAGSGGVSGPSGPGPAAGRGPAGSPARSGSAPPSPKASKPDAESGRGQGRADETAAAPRARSAEQSAPASAAVPPGIRNGRPGGADYGIDALSDAASGAAPIPQGVRTGDPNGPGYRLDPPAAAGPEPAGTAAPPAPSAGALFARALEILRAEKPAVAAVLGEFSSVRAAEGALEILFGPRKEDFIGIIRGERPAVEAAVARAFGRSMEVRLATETGEAPAPPRAREAEMALENPAVRHFVNTFKASVLRVDPLRSPSPDREPGD